MGRLVLSLYKTQQFFYITFRFDDDSVVDGGFVGVGSLPLPEEHFVDDTEYPQQQHSDDITFGLAVATAIDPDEEEAYIYNAIEYDPDAKPPLHNR